MVVMALDMSWVLRFYIFLGFWRLYIFLFIAWALADFDLFCWLMLSFTFVCVFWV